MTHKDHNYLLSFTFDIFDTLNLFREVRAAAQNRAWRNCLHPGWDISIQHTVYDQSDHCLPGQNGMGEILGLKMMVKSGLE